MAYRLSFDGDVADAVRAVARAELATATTLLRDEFDADPQTAVHDARKSLKKTRALVRLVRPAIGKRVYRRENRALRDAGRLISGARDADALVETVEKLADRFAGRIPAADFEALREHVRAVSLASQAGPASGEGRAAAVAMLDAVAARIDDWPLADGDWSTIGAGIERAYRAGCLARDEVAADPTVERLHDWRKRVKDLWYQQRLVCPAWPDVLGAQAEQAHHLSELLGDDHDLAVLAGFLTGDADGPEPVDEGAVIGLVAARRSELQAEARHVGALIYAERPAAFARRTGRYLDEARAAVPAEAGNGRGH